MLLVDVVLCGGAERSLILLRDDQLLVELYFRTLVHPGPLYPMGKKGS
jgi:hypothetical protein